MATGTNGIATRYDVNSFNSGQLNWNLVGNQCVTASEIKTHLSSKYDWDHVNDYSDNQLIKYSDLSFTKRPYTYYAKLSYRCSSSSLAGSYSVQLGPGKDNTGYQVKYSGGLNTSYYISTSTNNSNAVMCYGTETESASNMSWSVTITNPSLQIYGVTKTINSVPIYKDGTLILSINVTSKTNFDLSYSRV